MKAKQGCPKIKKIKLTIKKIWDGHWEKSEKREDINWHLFATLKINWETKNKNHRKLNEKPNRQKEKKRERSKSFGSQIAKGEQQMQLQYEPTDAFEFGKIRCLD